MCKTPAVDVEGFEDLQDGLDRDVPLQGPADDVEVFLARLDTIKDAIEQQRVVVKLPQQEAEVASVQLDDVANCAKLLAAFAQRLTGDSDFGRG